MVWSTRTLLDTYFLDECNYIELSNWKFELEKLLDTRLLVKRNYLE